MEENTKTKSKFSIVRIIQIFLTVALVGSVATLGYLYYQTRQELNFLASPDGQSELAKREVEQVVSALEKLVILPEEEPVIATITDNAALATQSAFYTNAVNGDKLVVYSEAQQAFIYSPSRNKIVNVGPLLIEDAPVGENSQGATENVTPRQASVEVRNGSGEAGQATQLSQQIRGVSSNITVSTADAANSDYEGVTVVDNSSGEFFSLAQQLATELGGQVQRALPSDEAASSADIVVIIGS